jgi:acyl dehydratase
VALNRDFIGRDFPPSPPYEVGREKIREFAEAIGDTNPAYVDPDAAKALGYPDVIAPPTFAIVLSFRISDTIVADSGLGLDYSLVVHGEQRFVHVRPIRAGDVLVVTPRITAIRDAGRNELMTWEADIRTVEGEPVCVATNTLVSRGTAAPKSSAG